MVRNDEDGLRRAASAMQEASRALRKAASDSRDGSAMYRRAAELEALAAKMASR